MWTKGNLICEFRIVQKVWPKPGYLCLPRLINSTPDTSGLIPEGDAQFFKTFGEEIDRRFKNPVAEISEKKGTSVTLKLPGKQKINHVVTMEDYRQGHRIRSYKIDLSKKINIPGQFTVKLDPENPNTGIEIAKAEIYYEGHKALDEFLTIKGSELNINRTAMVTDESSSVLHLTIKCLEPCNGTVEFRPAIIY